MRSLAGTSLCEAEDVGKRDFGHPAAADGGDAGAAEAVERHRFAVGADDLLDRRARNGEMLRADRHGQRRDDGQGQRHPQRHPRALARRAVDLDDAADPLDVGADHVHADPAAGDCGDFAGGRQAGFEDQRQLLARAEQGGLVLGGDARGNRLFDQLLAVDAAAVVLDVDQNLVARLAGGDGEDADLALAGLHPLGRGLDAVVDGVADDVGQGIADHLDHLAVELDVAALDIDQHLLAELGRQVADHPRQRDEQILDPLHAGAGDRVAHLGDDRRQALEGAVDRHVGRRFAKPPGKLVAGEHHVGNRAHHPVEQLDRKPDGARRRRAPVGLGHDRGQRRRRAFGAGLQRVDQVAVVAFGDLAAAVDRRDHLADAVDDGEHRADQRAVGLAAAGADVGERVLGGVAQRFQPREFEEAAIAFDGVDEAEDGIEARAVVGRGFPGDDLAAQRLEHFPAFGNEIGNQIVHRRSSPQASRAAVMRIRS